MDICNASKVYTCGENFVIKYNRVSWPEFKEYSYWIRKFDRHAKVYFEDDEIRQIIHYLKKYGFKMCTTPLPIKDTYYMDSNSNILFDNWEKFLKNVYPDLQEIFEDLPSILARVNMCEENPLLQALMTLLKDEDPYSTAVLIHDAYAIERVQDYLKKTLNRKYKVITYHRLIREVFTKKLIIIGSSNWYPRFVFNSPRVNETELVVFDWIKDNWENHEPFISPVVSKIKVKKKESEAINNTDDILSADNIKPAIDWKILYSTIHSRTSTENKSLHVNAVIVKLEGEVFTLLENEESSKVLSINFSDDEEDSKLKKIPVKEIIPGMYIVLRTEGGSDLLVPIADKLLGDEAEQLRLRQKEWKEKLKEKMDRHGTQNVVQLLQSEGCTVASPNNVRNWVSMSNHKTQNFTDFKAIMTCLGLEDRLEILWNGASTIERAHRKAGFIIRNLLLNKIRQVNFDELERFGKMDFSTTAEGGGRITVFRISAISPDSIVVPEYRIGSVFEEDKIEWLE